MTRTRLQPFPFALAAMSGLLGLSSHSAGQGTAAPDEVVTRLEPGGDIDTINLLLGTATLGAIVPERIYRLQIPGGFEPEDLVLLLEVLPEVDWAEPNFFLATMDGTTGSFFVSVDPRDYHGQYAIDLINTESPPGALAVLVAVLDTGVDATHVDLAGRIAPGGFDFVDVDADPDDSANAADDDGDGDIDELVGHGTFVAGVVALISANADILPVRVLDSDGGGYSFQVAEGIYWSLDHGAGVINLSLAADTDANVLTHAMQSAEAADVLVVAAAGNLDTDTPQWPAADAATLAVAATDACNVKSAFSNYGSHIAISAPGSQIVGLLPGDQHGRADGTSFSAALVTAGAAIVRGVDPGATAAQTARRLASWAAPIDQLNPSYAGLLGAGRLDIGAALDEGATPQCPSDQDADGTTSTADLLALLAAWGPNPGHPADLDGDCGVGTSDLLALLAAWGPCP